MRIPASNRQKKILRFFGIQFSPNLSAGAAGWEIEDLLSDERNREQWRKYLFLTKDFDSNTDSLKQFSTTDFNDVVVPESWRSSDAIQHFKEELVANLLCDQSPFDRPQPAVVFAGKSFVFTGKFAFGSRKKCLDAVLARGGVAPSQKSVNQFIDYLVVGIEGSAAWKRGAYGNKIEDGVLSRREHGTPAIISEQQWAEALTQRTT
ncbi:MAG: hypothetical protein FJ386_12480 [Verrucomicrobia bacterium]|nr:hypothetical protein [Verrucomicrobiota bacterium]